MDAAAIDMQNRVRFVGRDDWTDLQAGHRAIVTIRTRDGRNHSSTVYAPKGAAILGIDWADVEAKYRALAPFAKLSGKNLDASMKVIRNFREVKKVSELVGLLR